MSEVSREGFDLFSRAVIQLHERLARLEGVDQLPPVEGHPYGSEEKRENIRRSHGL
jgi:hypothetical protein